MSEPSAHARRAFVLGFDGLAWELIDRWSEDGTLPNFGTMRSEGSIGPLDSTRPPTTPLAWPSIATGVWPDKHGIYGFQHLTEEYSHRMATSHDWRQPAVWELLEPALVGNVPMTYPPRDIDGTMVTGMMTPSTRERYTHPPEFAEAIAEAIPEYQISVDYPEYADRPAAFADVVESMLERRHQLLRLLLDVGEWRVLFFVFTAPDRFQHLIWDEPDLRSHYRRLDEILGDAMTVADEQNADLYVVSDHGFGKIDRLVHANNYLKEAGFLVPRENEGARSALSTLGISRDGVSRALNAVGITEERLLATLPRRFVDAVAEQIPGDHALYDVDYGRTTAFVHEGGNCYVNDVDRFSRGTVEPEDVPAVKTAIVELFESVTAPDGDEPILRVRDGDELFPTDDRSPDLVVGGIGPYEVRTAIGDGPFGDTSPRVASHRPDGIICCRGPSFESCGRFENATVVDVVPTLLHALGESVPANVDGRVLREALCETSPASNEDVTYVSVERSSDGDGVEDDFSDVEERLRGLGYMQ